MKHWFTIDNEELKTYKCYTCGRTVYESDIQLESMREDCIEKRQFPPRKMQIKMQLLTAALILLADSGIPIISTKRKKHDFEIVNGTAKCKECGKEMDLADFDKLINESCEGKLNTKENKSQ